MAPIFTLLPQTWGFDKEKGLWMNIGRFVKKKNAFIIYIKNKNNRDTGEVPPLIDLLKEAIQSYLQRSFIQSFQI